MVENRTNDDTVYGKRPRNVLPETEFSQYYIKTQQKIAEIKQKIKNTTDKKEIKRYKNMISAYGSRLHKREDVEQLKEQVEIRNQQISVMLQVLKSDLPQHQYMDIVRRIRDQTPTINHAANNTK